MALVYCNEYISIKGLERLLMSCRRSTHVILIGGEPMVYARGHDHQISLLQPNSHPIVILTPNIKVPSAIQYISDLLILMEVLVEEVLDLFFVVGKGGGRDVDLVAVLVRALAGDPVDGINVVWEVVVDYAERGEVVWVDSTAAVMWLALVTLSGGQATVCSALGYCLTYRKIVEPICLHIENLSVDRVCRCRCVYEVC